MKPILFNTEMVQAILDGRKTVTRRLVKPQPEPDQIYQLGCCVDGDRQDIGKFGFGNSECGGHILYVRPPYKAGDILYVRETWLMADDGDYYYKANESETSMQVREALGYKWSPSIHMPKEASRIFLRVVGVHVERLQDMPHDGAQKEGIYFFDDCGFTWEKDPHIFLRTPMSSMGFLWDLTYKKQNYAWRWEANPWVWVIEFERCEKPVEYSPW